MFNFARAISRAARPAASVLKQSAISANFSAESRVSRSLWHMCSTRSSDHFLQIEKPSLSCSCGCGARHAHTKGEQELIEFLTEEIATETQNRKYKTVPTEVDGFKVKSDGAEVTFTKTVGDETIEISLNVNHTVDTDAAEGGDINPNMDKPEFPELKSKPNFEVDIKRGDQTLSFTCSFLTDEYDASEEGYNDLFGINEVTLYKGEWSDKTYAVAGDVLDGCLYDLLMNLLEEKGISNEFAEKLIQFCTAYESSLYINLLNNVQKFTARK